MLDIQIIILIWIKKLTVVKSMSGSYSQVKSSAEECWLSGMLPVTEMVSSGNAMFRPKVPESAIIGPHVLFPLHGSASGSIYAHRKHQQKIIPPLNCVLDCTKGSCCWPEGRWTPMFMFHPGGRSCSSCLGDLSPVLTTVTHKSGHRTAMPIFSTRTSKWLRE